MPNKIQLLNTGSEPTLTMRMRTTPGEISNALREVFSHVGRYAAECGAEMAGPPFTIYHSYSPGVVDLEAGMTVKTAVKGNEQVQAGTLPAGRSAVAWHEGPFEGLHETHMAIGSWMKENGLEAAAGCREIYWTDPDIQPDSSKWRTEVVLPVKDVKK